MPNPGIFQIEHRNLKELIKFYKRAPRQFQHATAGVLNNQAFGTRKAAVHQLGRNMIIRNPKFVNSKVRVTKARPSQPINLQQAETGSIRSARFSGWVEQETGQKTLRTRTQTLFSRGNTRSGIVKSQYRMRRGARFTDSSDFADVTNNPDHRTIAMLSILRRNKFKRPFIMRRNKRKGLYKLIRNKPKLVQNLDPQNPQPKKKPWLIPGRTAYFNRTNLTTVWAEQIGRQVKFLPRR